jgi:(2Fe-2S) ferredoxin
MKRYRVSVCKGMDCKADGANELFAQAREELARRGLTARCELYRGGCYGLCHLGPNVVVREDTGRKRDPFSREDFQLMGWEGEAYYARMTAEKLQRIIAEHLAEDRPVTELYGQPEEQE